MRNKLAALTAFLVLASTGLAIAQYNQGPPPPNDPWDYHGQPGTYRPEWERRPPPRAGACFYTDAHFRGYRFCVRAGDKLPSLPEGYGHSISSIQTFGRVGITVFSRPGFRGQSAEFGMMDDLGRTSQGPFRGWNDRISSMIIH